MKRRNKRKILLGIFLGYFLPGNSRWPGNVVIVLTVKQKTSVQNNILSTLFITPYPMVFPCFHRSFSSDSFGFCLHKRVKQHYGIDVGTPTLSSWRFKVTQIRQVGKVQLKCCNKWTIRLPWMSLCPCIKDWLLRINELVYTFLSLQRVKHITKFSKVQLLGF